MKLLEEAATLVETKNRRDLLNIVSQNNASQKNDKIMLTTRYNPNFQDLRQIVYGNWDMLGKSTTTDFLYEKRLMCAYKRPKNLRDMLVRANTPYLEGDEKSRPNWTPTPILGEEDLGNNDITEQNRDKTKKTKPKSIQMSILDFLAPVSQRINIQEQAIVPIEGAASGIEEKDRATVTGKTKEKSQLTSKKNRGFNFCNIFNCRYCKLINKSGTVTSTVTNKEFMAMKNISCRSSNLVYSITCKRCGKQYVGQTCLRLKGRFVHHFYTVEKPDKSKPVGKHFSQLDHKGIDDMDINILEFIKKPPKSLAAAVIRDRVEKRWIHLLRSTAPGGLNLDD
jgi:hypothetical protein